MTAGDAFEPVVDYPTSSAPDQAVPVAQTPISPVADTPASPEASARGVTPQPTSPISLTLSRQQSPSSAAGKQPASAHKETTSVALVEGENVCRVSGPGFEDGEGFLISLEESEVCFISRFGAPQLTNPVSDRARHIYFTSAGRRRQHERRSLVRQLDRHAHLRAFHPSFASH